METATADAPAAPMQAAADVLAAPIQNKLQRWAAAGEVAEYYELKNRCRAAALSPPCQQRAAELGLAR